MHIAERKNRSIVIDGIVNEEVRSRNFGGEERKHPVTGRTVNSPGRRNFLLYLPEEIAEELKDRGCEVKYSHTNSPNDVPAPYVSITVSYYLRPAEVNLISNGIVTPLDEAHVYQLNDVDIQNLCMELEFGKEKTHLNGDPYVPIFAQKIWVEITPSYIYNKYAHLMQPASVGGDEPF